MVTIRIIAEGGDYNEQVANNVESLRQSLNQFFARVLDRDDISIIVKMGASNRNAAKLFANDEHKLYLFVDSDDENKSNWFEKLANKANPDKGIVIPDEKKTYVYFMIQEMEAWFLKQPDCLVKWAKDNGYNSKRSCDDIPNHTLIRGKNIETIEKPSEKLAMLLKTFFEKERDGKKKAARYGKLTTAPKLLDALNVVTLIPLDSELQRFKASLSSV